MKNVFMLCAAIAAFTPAAQGQSIPSSDSGLERLINITTIGYGAALRINASGQVLVVTDTNVPGGEAERTFIWSTFSGLKEIRFAGATGPARGSDLSDTGLVVGRAVSPAGTRDAFVWSEPAGISTVGADAIPQNAIVVAVNDSGEIVAVDPVSQRAYRATTTGTFKEKPTGVSVRCSSNAAAISRWGESVGASDSNAAACADRPSSVMHAYVLRRDGTAVDLGTLGGDQSQALAINDRGQAVGWSFDAGGTMRGFLWSINTGMIDLGTLGGRTSRALGVNNLGQVIGVSQTASDETHSFIWSRETGMIDIGPGIPAAINDLGQVAGTSGEGGDSVAYFWSPDDGRHVLAPNARALDINNNGQVVGARNTLTPPEFATLWQLSVTTAERINWYEGRAATLEYGHVITPDQAAACGKWVSEARASVATGEAAALADSLRRLADALGEPLAASVAADAITPAVAPAAILATSATGASAYNLKVVTDASPDLSDLKSLIDSTTSRWPSPKEKVWAMFYWSHILKRQTPPMILHGWEVTDPIRNLVDYGFTQCSTVSGINQSLYEGIGLRHQLWDGCAHTVAGVEYDGSFHMVDSSMSNLVTKDDGVTLASVEEAAANSARLVRQHSLYSSSPDGFLTGSDTIRNLSDVVAPDGGILTGYSRAFCEGSVRLRTYYYNWDSGHRHILNLRDNESYTRYYGRLGSTSDYWVGTEDSGDPTQTWEIDSRNVFGLRGNGNWSFSPRLSADGYAQALYRSANIAPAAGGGLQPSAAGQTAEAIYKVQAADAITSQTIQAQFSRTDASASATISVSLNHGLVWKQVASVTGTGAAVPVTASLRNDVSGAYETLIRIQMNAGNGSPSGIILTSLRIDTLTQVNTKALPQLNIGRNQIYVGAGDQSDSMVLWPDLRQNYWQKDVYASSNIAAQNSPLTGYTAVAYPAISSQDAYLVYRMDAPTDVTRLVYGGRLYNRAAGSYIDFLHSFDNGANWIRSYRLSDTSQPYDVIHYETVTGIPAGIRTVLFKFLMHGGGLYSVRMEADHAPQAGGSREIDVSFRWKEIRSDRTLVSRRYKQRVSTFPFTYTIDVGGSDHPVMDSLTVNVQGAGDGTPYGYSDGIDVGGEKFVNRERADGTNLAKGRPYTISRAPSGDWNSARSDNTTILTDGIVGAPATGGTSYWWGQCWYPGQDVDLQVDLGQVTPVAAVRAHLFGYEGWDALKGEVRDRVEILTSTDGAHFASQGVMQTSLWKKDIPINHMLQDDESATAWNFEHTLPTGVSARYVRYHMTPQRILCASELQVFDRVEYRPFDIRIALPAGSVPPPTGDTTPPAVAVTAPSAGSTVSGSIPLGAAASDDTGVTAVEFLVDGSSIASDATSPYSGTWDSSSVANGVHTIAARAADAAGNTATSSPVTITVANTAPPITPTVLPGTIEAEAFDQGGAEISYHDTSPGNSGGAYRNTDVDLEATTDAGGGYNVGWVSAGEWLNYAVSVAAAGPYVLAVRVASPGDGGRFHVEINGVNVTGSLGVPNTGGWQAWATVTKGAVMLAAGTQVWRLVMDTVASTGAVGNFNWLRVTAGAGGSTPFTGTPVSLPGTIQAEAFDEGGAEIAYHDGSAGNSGGAYRNTDVDLEATTDAGAGYNVGWVSAGEWLNYTVNVAAAGPYSVAVRVATLTGGGTFHVEANGVNVTGPLSVPNTGAWQAWATVTKDGVPLSAGTQVLRLVMDTANVTGSVGNFNWLRVTSMASASTPFTGTPVALPGTIQAEAFDEGGAEIAYHDASAGNNGGAYRNTDVDLEATSDAGGGYNVGWVSAGEWLNYTVGVATAGTYTLEVRVASPGEGGAFHVERGGIDITGPLAVPNTGGWQAWTSVTKTGVVLPAGTHILRLVMNSVASTGAVGNFNWLRVTATTGGSTPFTGAPAALPGTIEAEAFDEGGAEIAYHDASTGNSGGTYRSTDVDLEATTDAGGGYNVGWVSAGEWVNYTVSVASAGQYTVEVRVASPGDGGTFHVEANGVNVTGPLTLPNTGGWQRWATVTRNDVALAAGTQVLRLVMDAVASSGAVGNFNWLRVTSAAPAGSVRVFLTTADQTHLLSRGADASFRWPPGTGQFAITVNDDQQFQDMIGFGASLTESSAWLLYTQLGAAVRADAMNRLFSPTGGIGLSFLRQPIGASDFSLSHYSYDDVPFGESDYPLSRFSAARDDAYVFPAVSEARRLNPQLTVMASPWSPPAWMKSSGSLVGGSLLHGAYGAFATYLTKSVQALESRGIPVAAITLQNEPYYQPPDYPGMYMDATEQATLIAQHVGPALAAAGLATRILAWDHNWDEPGYALAVLQDERASAYVSGVAYHCYAGNPGVMSDFHEAHPSALIYVTECSSGGWESGLFGSELVENMRLLIRSIRNWAQAVVKWNVALDENNGPHTGGCVACSALLTVNRSTGSVQATADFYALGQVSTFVLPGARRIGSTSFESDGVESVAFINRDGTHVLVVWNGGGAERIAVNWRGSGFGYDLPPQAAATFVW